MGKNGFFPKCRCRATGNECIYQVCHWTKNHIDSYGQQSTAQSTITSALSANVSHHVLELSAGVPSGPPEVTVTEAFAQHEKYPDKIEFLRMWCAPVFISTCTSATFKKFTLENERGIKNVSNIDKNANANEYEIKIDVIEMYLKST